MKEERMKAVVKIVGLDDLAKRIERLSEIVEEAESLIAEISHLTVGYEVVT